MIDTGSHVIEWRHQLGAVTVICRRCGVIAFAEQEDMSGILSSRHRARHFPEFRRRVPAWSAY